MKTIQPIENIDFFHKKAKTVKLSPILSTFWAGTVGVLAAKRKDRTLTLSATAPDQLRRLQHPKLKEGIGWLVFTPNIRSYNNKIEEK